MSIIAGAAIVEGLLKYGPGLIHLTEDGYDAFTKAVGIFRGGNAPDAALIAKIAAEENADYDAMNASADERNALVEAESQPVEPFPLPPAAPNPAA